MEEYPLAVGIGFAALGALIGVLLPRTRREDELLGEQSDQLVEGDERERPRIARAWQSSRANAWLRAPWKRPGSRASRQKRRVRRYLNLPGKSER